jgi:ArsR family metal-binding transcriptional regulator
VEKQHLDTSVLDNCRISFVGAGITVGNYLTRAIFELSGDISPAMPHLSRVISNCGYTPGAKTIAFRVRDMPVVVRPDRITINNMRDLETAHEFLAWLKDKMESAV